MNKLENTLIAAIEYHLNKILDFDGYSKYDGVTNPKEFIYLMDNDPAFNPFGLGRDKYVTARIGGNLITSIHRKLGDLYEDMIIALLHDKYGFSKEYLKFSLNIVIDGNEQERTTDGRIMIADIDDKVLREETKKLIVGNYEGLALEVRSCYQIGDSKRIQADEHMAKALKAITIDPKLVIFCNTSLTSPVKRLSKHWDTYQGKKAFEFTRELTGFDLYQFLIDNKKVIDPIMDKVFQKL